MQDFGLSTVLVKPGLEFLEIQTVSLEFSMCVCVCFFFFFFFFFFSPTALLRLHEPVWSALVTRLRGRLQGWEGWPRAVRQVEDSLQRRVPRAPIAVVGQAKRVRAHSLLHGHGQDAPPTPRPPPHSSWRAETPEAHEGAQQEAARLRVPAAPNFRPQHKQTLRARAAELRVSGSFAALRQTQRRAILTIGVRLGLALSCERGYEGGIATECAPGGSRAIDHEVEPTLVPGLPSGPTASRATRTQARSSPFARRARRPVRGHASEWSQTHPCVGHNHVRHPPHSVVGPKATGGATAGAAQFAWWRAVASTLGCSARLSARHRLGWGLGPAAARSRDSKGCESATHAAANHAASHQGLLRLRSGHVGGRLRAPSATTTLGS